MININTIENKREPQICGVRRAVGSGKIYRYSTIAKGDISYDSLPDSYMLPFLPDILDQKSVQSCVAHSLAETFQAQDPTHALISVLEIYGLWRNHKGVGMYPEITFEYGRKIGTCLRSIAPENIEVPQAIQKAREYQLAHPNDFIFKVGSYFKIDHGEDDDTFRNPSFEYSAHALLNYKVPLFVLTQKGAHAEICVGYCKTGAINPIDGKPCRVDSLIIQNSWGNIPFPRRDEPLKNIEEAYLILMDKINVPFTDIDGHWAKQFIEKAYFAGYLNGRTETTFEPEGEVKRGEMAKILSLLLTNYDEKISKLEERIEELEEA